MLLCAAPFDSVAAVLGGARRDLAPFASKFPAWDDLFSATSATLAAQGMSVKQRRYTLWLLEKLRYAFTCFAQSCGRGDGLREG